MWSNNPAMKTSRNLVTLSLLIPVLFLSACSGLTKSDKPATKTWWLEPYTTMALTESEHPALLLNASVTVVPGLDTDRILTLSDHSELNHYNAAQWAENLPELLASLSSRTLESSGMFEVVSNGGGPESCDLRLEVREFFADMNSSGQTTGVRLDVSGRFECQSADVVPLQLSASVPVHDDRMSVIVAAFQQALDSVMKDLLNTLKN